MPPFVAGSGDPLPVDATRPARGDANVIRPRILAFAYDVEPDRGSEPGAGWASIRILAGFADVTVITRRTPPSPDRTFDAWTARIPEAGWIHFARVGLPGDPWWAGAGDRPALWSRQHHFGYLVWLALAGRAARRLHAEEPFDLTWHLTWANGWFGSTLSSVDAPFVLGPIGGGVSPPWRLVAGLGPRGIFFELARAGARMLARYFNPLAHRTWRRARLILVQNRETRDWLPAGPRRRARVFNNATVVGLSPRTRRRAPGDPPVALFAGRLVPLKGGHLAVRAIAGLPDWRLVICGDGPDETKLRSEAAALGITDRVEFRGWRQRDEVLRAMADEADVLLFPSLHDEAGLAVAEAAAIGLPIVCLDRGGPPVIAGGGVAPGSEEQTVEGLRAALRTALDSEPTPARLDPETRRRELMGLLREAGLLPAGDPEGQP